MKMLLPVYEPVRAIDAVLDKFTQSLMTIARAELPEAEFSEEIKPNSSIKVRHGQHSGH